jgi:CRISPR-associated protein (TIGR03986 family)
MNFTSPYNFVPLAENVHHPEQQCVSQDFPLESGYTGTMELELNNLNDLILGDQDIEGLDYQPFFKTPDGYPAIPGTSLKGMIRNLIEIATGGYIEMNQNQFSQRDLTNAKNDYMKTLRGKKSGWLYWDSTSESWNIAPTITNFKTIRHTPDVNHNEKNANTDVEHILEDLLPTVTPPIHKIESAVDRYLAILQAKQNANKIGASVEILTGQYLIVTNQLEDSKKRREFLFSAPDFNKSKAVDSEVFRKFEYVMDKSQTEMGSNHWGFLKDFSKEGIPVFYLQNAQNKISAFGLASLFRLPYEKALFDLLPSDHRNKTSKNKSDFAGLLFGEIPTADQTSISRKGRVSFGLAKSKSVGSYETHRLVLANPKATYYPAYLKQSKNDLRNYNSANQINGFKQYLPHQTLKQSRIPLKKDGSENLDITKQVEVLTSKHSFKSKVRVHNLTSYELGALIWATTLGELEKNSSYQHLLGMGKPLGYGKVQINIGSFDIKEISAFARTQKSKEFFLNEFYAYLAVNNLLNEGFATLKATHRNSVVNDQDLNYLVLDPAKKRNDFLEMREAKTSLPKLKIEPEKAMVEDIRVGLSELIDVYKQRQHALQLKIEEERVAQEQHALEQAEHQKHLEQLNNRKAFEILFEDVFEKEINKKALLKLIDDPSLYQSLPEEEQVYLKNKIEVSDWFKGLKKRRSAWRKKLPDLLC